MMAKPAFDPSQPFEPVANAPKPSFDPSQPFQPINPTWQDKAMGMAKEALPYAAQAAEYTADPMSAVADAGKWVADNPREAFTKAGPWLPTAGAVAGSAIAPGVGTAVGAGLGEIARQAGDVVFGMPGAQVAGENFSPRAGINAATQTALAGAGEVTALGAGRVPFQKIMGPENAPYVQRGIQAVGEKLAPVGEGIRTGVSRLQEAFTGVPGRQAAKLIDEPRRLVSGIGQLGSRGQAVGDAEEVLTNKLMNRAGPDLPGTFRLTPDLEAAITTNKGGVADDIVTNLLTKAKNPASISTDEAVAGIRAIDRTFPNYTAQNAKIVQKYADLRSTLSEIVSGADSNVGTAKAAFNDAKVGADFRNVFRQTKAGKVSAVPFLSFLFSPQNWSGEQLAGQAMKLPLFSPAAWGTGMAAGSAGIKAVGAVASSPAARQALISRYVTKHSLDQGHL